MQLNTLTWGDGAKTALLLHGITSNGAGWWRVGPAFADRGYRVVAPDLRGHGGSPASGDHLLASHAEDVAALGDHWDVVLGHSMGGAVAVTLAAARPAWTDLLILEDPAILFPDLPAVIAWLLPDFERTVDADELMARNPDWDRRDAEWKAEALSQCGADVVEATFTQNDPWDLRVEVAALQTPTTIIGAEPGRTLVPSPLGAQLAENPLVGFAQVLGSHSMHRDRWDDFWGVVRPLL